MNNNFKIASLALALSLAQQANADIVYNVSESFGGGTITGTLTTDGSLGVISNQAQIVDWNLTISNANGSSSLNTGNATLYSANFKFTATASDLTFDHSFGNYFLVYENNLVGFWCLEGVNNGCAGFAGESVFAVNVNGNRQYVNSGRNHDSVFSNGNANNIPEPFTLALVGIGLVAGAVTRKTR